MRCSIFGCRQRSSFKAAAPNCDFSLVESYQRSSNLSMCSMIRWLQIRVSHNKRLHCVSSLVDNVANTSLIIRRRQILLDQGIHCLAIHLCVHRCLAPHFPLENGELCQDERNDCKLHCGSEVVVVKHFSKNIYLVNADCDVEALNWHRHSPGVIEVD